MKLRLKKLCGAFLAAVAVVVGLVALSAGPSAASESCMGTAHVPDLVTFTGNAHAAGTATETRSGDFYMNLHLCSRLEYWNGSSWQALTGYACNTNSGPSISATAVADCRQIFSLHGAVSLRTKSQATSTPVAPPGPTQTATRVSAKSRPCPGT